MYGLQAGQIGQGIPHTGDGQFANRTIATQAGEMPEIERELSLVRGALEDVRSLSRELVARVQAVSRSPSPSPCGENAAERMVDTPLGEELRSIRRQLREIAETLQDGHNRLAL